LDLSKSRIAPGRLYQRRFFGGWNRIGRKKGWRRCGSILDGGWLRGLKRGRE
jgi:hypothetical protein